MAERGGKLRKLIKKEIVRKPWVIIRAFSSRRLQDKGPEREVKRRDESTNSIIGRIQIM